MPLKGFDSLFENADRQAARTPVAVAGAHDPTVLKAIATAAARRWIQPILVGPESEIRSEADRSSVALDGFEILDTPEDAVGPACASAAHAGLASLIMKGRITTPQLIHALLDRQHGLRTNRVACQVVLMEIPRDRRRFLLADTGISVKPPLEDRADIMRSAIELAQALGVDRPRVGLLAATETVKETMPETLGAWNLAERNRAGEFAPAQVEGPLSFDLAYSPVAVERKHLDSRLSGACDIMIFPDLLSANLTVKAIMYTADCRFGGVLMGLRKPVVFMSRADDTPTRLNSLALALKISCDS
jgi:phosphotransacetylase